MMYSDDHDGRTPSLLRESIEECNSGRYYCSIVVTPLGDVIDVLGHVNVLERINVTLPL